MEITGRRSRTICQRGRMQQLLCWKQPISVLMSSGHTEYPTKVKAILDAAQEKGLYVNFGLYIKRETDGFDYNNAAAVKAQFDEMKATVERFKGSSGTFGMVDRK